VIFLALRLGLFIPMLLTWALAYRDPRHRYWFDSWLGLREIRRERITPRHIKDLSTSHIPEDRLRYGLVRLYSVADNLVLNDYYERPYAMEPDLAELPGALLRYVVVAGAVVAGLTAVALSVWHGWLWTALLDAYNVPQAMRHLSSSLTADQRAALQYPFIINIWLLLGSELLFGGVAHLVAIRVLGEAQVRGLFRQVDKGIRRAVWKPLHRAGEPPAPESGLLRDQDAVEQHAVNLIQEFDIRTPSPDTSGGSLSGGNQQKMIVAREVSRRPRLLIASQPTRGIDVGSIEFIHRQIVDQRDAGAAVLLVSAELDEIMALSDRIAVMYKGEVIDTLPARDATREHLGLLMAGIKDGESASGAPVDVVPAEA
jgi:ABC-type dipeptide/oligopeptide/nickel transport system ATPase subunit